MSIIKNPIIALASCFVLAALCGCGKQTSKPIEPRIEEMRFACDASFENIMDQEIDVFEYSYNTNRRQAWVIPYYVSQRAAIDSLLDQNNSIRTVVTSRTLNAKEKAYLKNRKLNVREKRIAVDAIALIVNKDNPQDQISLKELRAVLSGEEPLWNDMWPSKLDTVRVVFDQNGSSVMQFVKDSICGGKPFASNVYAEQSARDVFDAVTSRKDALGIVGVSWISANMDGTTLSKEEMRRRSTASDTTNLAFNPEIKVLAVSGDESIEAFKPYQAYIYDGRYPLYRSVYMTTTTVGGTLNNAFYAFVTGMQGQKVIQLTGVLPGLFQPRMVSVSIAGQ